MNRVRIVNYLVRTDIIKPDYDALESVEFNLVKPQQELFDLLEDSPHVTKFSGHELNSIIKSPLKDLVTGMLMKGYRIPLFPEDYPVAVTIQLRHESFNDDLDLGTIKIQKEYIDWKNSYDEFSVKLTSDGITEVYRQLPYAKLYDSLEFTLIQNPDN